MAQPIYFLPGIQITRDTSAAQRRNVLQAAGLAEVFADVKPESLAFNEVLGSGPGGGSGSIVCYCDNRDMPPRFGYFPEQQTWHAIDDGAKLWIGLHNDYPATPKDMQRTKAYIGCKMQLADGNVYSIPVIRAPDGETSLPQSQYVEGGRLIKTLKPAYRRYWDATAEVADFIYAGKEILEIRAHELAVDAIGINYRFGPNEQRLLNLVDSENVEPILMVTVDFERVRELIQVQKKSEQLTAEQSNSSTGLPDVSPISDRPAASCSLPLAEA